MKRIVVIFLLITTGVISGVYYYWRQATNIPDWYTIQEKKNNSINIIAEKDSQQARNIEAEVTAITQPLGSSKDVELNLSEKDLNNILASEIAKKNNSSKISEAVKAVKTNIKEGKIEGGALVNISEIPTAHLRESETAAITRAFKVFPGLENREVYIGIEGKPTIEDGQLKFDENTKIKIGNLSFTQAELSEKLGIPESQIRQFTNFELQVGKLKVNDIELNDGKALLKGSVD
jgi:hypothetical protein